MQHDLRWIADDFHTASRNTRLTKQTKTSHLIGYEPELAEVFRQAPLRIESDSTAIPLPIDAVELTDSLEDTIIRRISSPNFSGKPVPLEKLGKLFYLANGVRPGSAESGDYKRNVANSGNLGSVELYCLALRVKDVEPGLYHFDSVNHILKELKRADYRDWVRERAILQCEFSDASALLILVSAVKRLCSKYGPRGYRLSLMDVGHVSQNIYLVATALDLDVCATGGFIDCELNNLLDLDGLDLCAQLVLGVSQR